MLVFYLLPNTVDELIIKLIKKEKITFVRMRTMVGQSYNSKWCHIYANMNNLHWILWA